MKRYHVTLWGHPTKPLRTLHVDTLGLPSDCDDYPSISVLRTETAERMRKPDVQEKA